MGRLGWLLVGLGILAPLSVLLGCDSGNADSQGMAGMYRDTGHHGHSHQGHHHGHSHGGEGPNGGHVIELGDGRYHAEWLHDDESGKVTVIILDEELKQEVPIAADSVSIDVAVDQKRKSYDLKAVNATGPDGEASRFEITSAELLVALKVGEGVDATLQVPIEKKLYMGRLEYDECDH